MEQITQSKYLTKGYLDFFAPKMAFTQISKREAHLLYILQYEEKTDW